MDKNGDGDYLVSARHLNCIFKISGTTGSVLWQLGGKNSSFLQDFSFTWQHDARFLEENSTVTIISFLDNESNGKYRGADVSSALVVALDVQSTPMTARLLKRIIRPDRELSHFRGNVQVMDNENTLVEWGTPSYLTEFSPDGTLLQEARFYSENLVNYRAFKYSFSAEPYEDPTLVLHSYNPSRGKTVSMLYISWNGATDVHSWNFYGAPHHASTSVFLGNSVKLGFETTFVYDGYLEWAIAEAQTATGIRLRNSSLVKVNFIGEHACKNHPISPPNTSSGHDFDVGIYLMAISSHRILWNGMILFSACVILLFLLMVLIRRSSFLSLV